jgi:UDP-N-acetylglucosamine pyrophosphorylase
VLPLALPLHAARKGVVAWKPEAGRAAQLQGVKLERFLFDVYPRAPRAEVLEVAREREFAPIKNATGADSPATARALVEAEVRRWHRERGLPEPVRPELRPLEMDGTT